MAVFFRHFTKPSLKLRWAIISFRELRNSPWQNQRMQTWHGRWNNPFSSVSPDKNWQSYSPNVCWALVPLHKLVNSLVEAMFAAESCASVSAVSWLGQKWKIVDFVPWIVASFSEQGKGRLWRHYPCHQAFSLLGALGNIWGLLIWRGASFLTGLEPFAEVLHYA